MGFIGFRTSDKLQQLIEKAAKTRGLSVSTLCRDIIRDNLDTTMGYSNWKAIAWNLFNITADQLNYALNKATCPDDFFSIVSKWSKVTKIQIIPGKENVTLKFEHQGEAYIIREPRNMPKLVTIANIIELLDTKIYETYMKGEADGNKKDNN
ncbi:MAG TPA: hypothetical protein PLS36_05745 [Clostridia bacterium]|nr:hypothetical protein [Clostridia bacterium]HXK71948.1 hypothetical protein [Clostridia bacterium]